MTLEALLRNLLDEVRRVNASVIGLRECGMRNEEIQAAIVAAESEADPLVLRISAFRVL